MEKIKDENNRLTNRLQSLEKKLFALGTPGKSPKASSSKPSKESIGEDSLDQRIDPVLKTPEKVKFSSDSSLIIDLNKEVKLILTSLNVRF